ncbi:Crp/Fnr family transcriptional regulator [Paenibacillus azoreducens]|uniref:Crp/Fnr family transcriptional regulator n=1 Tax=Paenibacillus azoreducens TaxID=116718 RepID=UPI0039F44E5B
MDIQHIAKYMEENSEIYRMLKHCPYEILRQWKLMRYSKGSMLFQQDAMYDRFCILLDGVADINIIGEHGKKYSQATYSAGDMIGEIEIYDLIPFVSNVEAMTDVTIMSLQRDYFLTWLQLDSNFNQYFIRRILYYNYTISKREGINILYPLHHRVCTYLLHLARSGIQYPQGITIKLNKQELSQKFAVTQRSINRILFQLRESGIIDIQKNELLIRDVKGLELETKQEARSAPTRC